MILSDAEICNLATVKEMIRPFEKSSVKTDAEGNKVFSYGLSSAGYDIRAADMWYVFKHQKDYNGIIDPKNFDENVFEVVKDQGHVIIPPNGFVLTHSVEYMKMPDNVIAVVQSKSSLARCGIQTLCTPLEPGWEGQITLEFCNTTGLPVKMYPNEGCCQVLFFKTNFKPLSIYGSRSGKYQCQTGITLTRV